MCLYADFFAARRKQGENMLESVVKIKDKIEKFALKPTFVFVVCLIAFVFHALAWDLAGLLIFAFVGGLFFVFLDDCRPALTVLFFTIFVVSTQNSTGFPPQSPTNPYYRPDYYLRNSTIIPLVFGGCFLFGCIIFRCVRRRENFLTAKSIIPLIAVSVSLVLSGVSSAKEYHYGESVLFSLVGVASYLGLYAVLSGVTDCFDGLLDFAMTLFSGVALIISLEIIYVYILNLLPPFEFLPDNWKNCMRSGYFFGSIMNWKPYLVTGCGVSNQSGAMLAFLLPAVFYKIYTTKRYIGYELLAFLAAVSIVLSLSRTAMLVGGPLFIVLSVFVAIKLEKKSTFFIVYGAFVVLALVALAIITVACDVDIIDYIRPSTGPKLNGRNKYWKMAVEYFKEAPIFGTGFAYPCYDPRFIKAVGGSFSPFRALYHSFFFQLVGSSGLCGLIATAYALVDIAIRFIKEKFDGKFFVFCFIIAFMVASLFDIIYFVPYEVFFVMFVIVVAEKRIYKNKKDLPEKQAD